MNITNYTIELQNIHLYARHGVLQQERAVGAWFTVDAKLQLSDHSSATTDAIEGTVSYADVYGILCREMEQPSDLLEHVCNRISKKVYESFSQVTAVSITLCKDTPPMGGDRLKAAVTLESRR